ncbi:MAG TPA: antitoxin [Sediminispirochaeta sp.]|nr:antitoxin [Sediminispirochaeta sp.]
MRTTLTIADSLYDKLNEKAHREKKSFKQVVNETISRGLLVAESPSAAARFTMEPHSCGRKAGIDYAKLNQLADELEAAENDYS